MQAKEIRQNFSDAHISPKRLQIKTSSVQMGSFEYPGFVCPKMSSRSSRGPTTVTIIMSVGQFLCTLGPDLQIPRTFGMVGNLHVMACKPLKVG